MEEEEKEDKKESREVDLFPKLISYSFILKFHYYTSCTNSTKHRKRQGPTLSQ